jgi:hypothetical protein
MTGVSGVGFGPPPRRALSEELVAVVALLAGNAPGLDFVGKVARVALVIEGESLECSVTNPERVELVPEIPLVVATITGHHGRVVDVIWREFVPLELI